MLYTGSHLLWFTDLVWKQHQAVLNLTKEPKLIEGANNSLKSVAQSQNSHQSGLAAAYNLDDNFLNAVDFSEPCKISEQQRTPLYNTDLTTPLTDPTRRVSAVVQRKRRPSDYLEMRKQPHLEDLGTLPNFDINSFESNHYEHHKEISFKLKQPVWQSFWNITL